MNGYFYSPQQSGFYHASIHAVLPADAVPITDARHAELMEALSQGQRIVMEDGQPQAAPPLPPSGEELLRQLRSQRGRLLEASDWTQMPDAPLDETVRAAWASYRQQLRDLPETIPDPADVNWPEPPTGESK